MSSSPELLKPDAEVTDTELQTELHIVVGNLELQNDALKQELEEARANYAALLESSGRIKANLETQLREERSDRQKWEEDFKEEFDSLQDRYDALLVESKNSAPAVAQFPLVGDLLNQLKARRKKSRVDLADVETFLEILDSELTRVYRKDAGILPDPDRGCFAFCCAKQMRNKCETNAQQIRFEPLSTFR